MFDKAHSDSRHRRGLRPSPALVVSIVALVLACAGGATAGTLITGKQVKNGSLTGADIRDKSLTARDIRGAGAALVGPAGPAGPKGDIGAPGPQGPKGDPGLVNLHVVSTKVTLAVGEQKFPSVECAAGERATGGGVQPTNEGVRILLSEPETVGFDPTPVGWAGGFVNRSGQEQPVFVSAICES